MSESPTILYCHCAHSQVVPDATKRPVLEALARSGKAFEAVADLCELSARKDPSLPRLLGRPGTQIIACHRRAVSWLMHAAGTELPKDTVVHNMRESKPDDIVSKVFNPALNVDTPAAVGIDPAAEAAAAPAAPALVAPDTLLTKAMP